MEGMKMSKDGKKASKALTGRRYSEVTDKKRKGLFLDEHCAEWQEDRKSVIRAPNHGSRCCGVTRNDTEKPPGQLQGDSTSPQADFRGASVVGAQRLPCRGCI